MLALLLPTAMGLYANFQGLQQILVPMQVEAIDPIGKIGNMALVTMICAVTGVLGLTLGGAGSDATRGRWGRRAPWLVAMAILSAVLTMGLASSAAYSAYPRPAARSGSRSIVSRAPSSPWRRSGARQPA